MHPGLGREDRRLGVERVGRADQDRLGARLAEHGGDVVEGLHAEARGEGRGAVGLGVAIAWLVAFGLIAVGASAVSWFVSKTPPTPAPPALASRQPLFAQEVSSSSGPN